MARAGIVESGISRLHPVGARAMIVALTCHLHHGGFRWVALGGCVRAAFFSLGLSPLSSPSQSRSVCRRWSDLH